MSNPSFIRITLPSGNQALYEVTELHLTHPTRHSRAEFVRMHAPQRAHELNGKWFRPGGWQEIDNPGTLATIHAAPHIDDENDRQGDEEPELVPCPQCGADNAPMGALGARVHYCCRACGWHYSRG